MIYIRGGDAMKNKGMKNEYCFIKEIDGKRLNELSFLIQELIFFYFQVSKNI